MSALWCCPRCKTPLDRADDAFGCATCSARYEVADGVPILVREKLSSQHLHQRRYFDAEFSEYESYVLESWRLSYIERIFSALGVLDRAAPYLDVGVGGSGATVIEAARRGVEATGCDLSLAGVLAARRFARDDGVDGLARFVVCAAEELPFPDASFGAASAVAVLEHLDDDRAAAAELARVTRPGGRVWVTVPHAFRYMPPPLWPVYWWHDRRIGHKRHYDEPALRRLLEGVGLRHVATRYSGHPVKVLQIAAAAAFPALRRPRSPLWWRLEQADRRAETRRWGAVQLSLVMRRPG